jgi:uncharacterized protein YajQ (UPF0234 family)
MLLADDEFKMNALWEVVQTRLVRQGVPVKNFKGDEQAAGGERQVHRASRSSRASRSRPRRRS